MKLDNKKLLIGLGAFAVIYALGESKQKKAKSECKVLVPTKFGVKYGFWSPKFFDLTPKLFRKVVTMKEWRKNYEINPIFVLATINDDRLVTKNGIFTIKDKKYYRQPSNDFLVNKNIKEITKADYQKEIDSYNKQRQQIEDDLNSCKKSENGARMPIAV